MQAAWPVACNVSETAAIEDGRSLDRQALQSLRVLLAGSPSRDSLVHSDTGRDVNAAVSEASVERDAARNGTAPTAEHLSASAVPRQSVSTEGKQDQQAAWRSSSRVPKQKGARLQTGGGPEDRDTGQGAEWQLSSLSQKALRTSRSSSLVSLLLVLMLQVTVSKACFAVHLQFLLAVDCRV